MISGLGIDLVDHARIRDMMTRVGSERVLGRLLTDAEREYCARMRDPYPHVAVRVAAKEACFKALSGDLEARAIAWQEIEVVHDEHRRPALKLHGRAWERAVALGVTQVRVSLTHSQHSAAAVVVLETPG
jgi:holo-[acyl-carrier protein] synthase